MTALLVIVALLLGAVLAAYFLLEKRPGYGIYYGLAKRMGARLDIGPVDWMTLSRRDTPNDALVCPGALCPNAKPDWDSRAYAMSPVELLARLKTIALAAPGTSLRTGLRSCCALRAALTPDALPGHD